MPYTRSGRSYPPPGELNTLGRDLESEAAMSSSVEEQIAVLRSQLETLMAREGGTVRSDRDPVSTVPVMSKVDKTIARPAKWGATSGENVSKWIFELELFFDAMSETEARRLVVTPTYFKDGALEWWMARQALVENDEEEEVTSWDQMKKLLREFDVVEDEENARRLIKRVKQGGRSVQEYSLYFLRLSYRLPRMDVMDKIDYYLSGLNEKVLLYFGATIPKKLSDAMHIAERVEANLRRAMSMTTAESPGRGRYARQGRGATRLYAMDPEEGLDKVSEDDYGENELYVMRGSNGRSGDHRKKIWHYKNKGCCDQWFA